MADASSRTGCGQVVLAFGCSVRDCYCTALGELDGHECGVHAHVADFHADVRGKCLIDFVRSEHACADQGCSCVDASFGEVIVFPALVIRNPGVRYARSHAAKESACRRVVLVACARHVLAFGVCGTVVRVGVVLVANAQDERNVPRVHAQHVVELVDAKLTHFVGMPVRVVHIRECNAFFFNIFCDIDVSKHFKDVTHLVAVVNPSLVRVHGKPNGVILEGTRFPVACCRECNGTVSVSAHVVQVADHVNDAVFDGVQPFAFGEAVFCRCFGLVGKNQLI